MSTSFASQPPLDLRQSIVSRELVVTAGSDLPVRLATPPEPDPSGWPPSWERVVVGAGLDRESHELSPAERWLADIAAGIVPRIP